LGDVGRDSGRLRVPIPFNKAPPAASSASMIKNHLPLPHPHNMAPELFLGNKHDFFIIYFSDKLVFNEKCAIFNLEIIV
jgi:hypothetical protein